MTHIQPLLRALDKNAVRDYTTLYEYEDIYGMRRETELANLLQLGIIFRDAKFDTVIFNVVSKIAYHTYNWVPNSRVSPVRTESFMSAALCMYAQNMHGGMFALIEAVCRPEMYHLKQACYRIITLCTTKFCLHTDTRHLRFGSDFALYLAYRYDYLQLPTIVARVTGLNLEAMRDKFYSCNLAERALEIYSPEAVVNDPYSMRIAGMYKTLLTDGYGPVLHNLWMYPFIRGTNGSKFLEDLNKMSRSSANKGCAFIGIKSPHSGLKELLNTVY